MPIIYSTKYNSPYKINDFSLIKFSYPLNENKSFYMVNLMNELNDTDNNIIQYSPVLEFDGTDRIDNIVWNGGSSEYKHIINKYTNTDLPIFQPVNLLNNSEFIRAELFLHQGFNWNDKLGILLVIKGAFSGSIFYSKLLKTEDFNISSNKILQYGNFWMESHVFEFPLMNEELLIQTVDVKISDVTNINVDNIPTKKLITTYPYDFLPLIQEKPLPDYIVTELSTDLNYFLHITPKTLENKTLENSLKDYFEIPRDKIISIQISHLIQYSGVNQITQLTEWKYLRVSNEENNFNEVIVGLDFSDWIDLANPSQLFTIDVLTEFTVDGKLMKRMSTISVSFQASIDLFNKHNVNPSTLIFNNVVEQIEVNQTVIEKPLETKIVKVLQPVFAQYITKDIAFANKNITFEGLIDSGYIVITVDSEKEILYSNKTSDGKIYFDLSQVSVTKNGTYELYLSNDNKIGEGSITV